MRGMHREREGWAGTRARSYPALSMSNFRILILGIISRVYRTNRKKRAESGISAEFRDVQTLSSRADPIDSFLKDPSEGTNTPSITNSRTEFK